MNSRRSTTGATAIAINQDTSSSTATAIVEGTIDPALLGIQGKPKRRLEEEPFNQQDLPQDQQQPGRPKRAKRVPTRFT